MSLIKNLLRRPSRSEPRLAPHAPALMEPPHAADLPPAATEVLGDLRERGIALVPFGRLWDGDGLCSRLAGDIDAFAVEAAARATGRDVPASKDAS